MYLTKQQHWELMHTQMDILKQREQLMEDIECIVEDRILSQFGSEFGDVSDDIIRVLCDAVCKNFPTN